MNPEQLKALGTASRVPGMPSAPFSNIYSLASMLASKPRQSGATGAWESPQVTPAPVEQQPTPTQLPSNTRSTLSGASQNSSNQSDPNQVASLANSLYSSLGKNTGLTYQNPTPGGSAIDQLSALQAQQANDKVNRTGMYAIDPNAGFNQSQVNQQENAGDQFYTEQKGKYGAQAQNELAQQKGGASVNLSGLKESPWLEGLRINGLVQGGTAAERNANLQYLASLPEDRQKQLVKSGIYNSMSTGERTKFDSYDEVSSGAQQILSMLPEDISTNPYKYAAEKYSSFLGGKGSKGYQQYEAILGRITAPIINNIYGAAVTGSELARAQTFIPDLAVDSTQRANEKLKNLAAFAEFAEDSAIAKRAGMSKPNLDDYIKKYSGIEQGNSTNPDQEALQNNYSQEEIDAFKKAHGISFNSVGNTVASNTPQRNNNPGNIKQGGLADKLAVGTDSQGHLIFPDSQTGFKAMQADIQAKVNGQSKYLPANPTLAQLGGVYAEDPKWTAGVAKILGVPPNTPTKNIPIDKLAQAIARQEGFYA